MKISVINYGMGNLRSVQKAFERIKVNVIVINTPAEVLNSDKLVLPGVGYFQHGMENLKNLGLVDAIMEAVKIKKIPILGICLGMQLLTNYSEEGNAEGLKLLQAVVRRFPGGSLKIPHMGWNTLRRVKGSSNFPMLDSEDMVYFVHSYYVKCVHPADVLYQTYYGIEFNSAFEHENIVGFQFHPEKSHQTGLKLLEHFSKM